MTRLVVGVGTVTLVSSGPQTVGWHPRGKNQTVVAHPGQRAKRAGCQGRWRGAPLRQGSGDAAPSGVQGAEPLVGG